MKRFLTITNNKIISDRFALEIVDGEIEDDGTYGEVGDILVNGVWTKPVQLPVIIQPSNKEVNDNLIVIMNGLTDIYMAILGF